MKNHSEKRLKELSALPKSEITGRLGGIGNQIAEITRKKIENTDTNNIRAPRGLRKNRCRLKSALKTSEEREENARAGIENGNRKVQQRNERGLYEPDIPLEHAFRGQTIKRFNDVWSIEKSQYGRGFCLVRKKTYWDEDRYELYSNDFSGMVREYQDRKERVEKEKREKREFKMGFYSW